MSETHEKPKTTKKEDVKDEVETFFPQGGDVFLPSLDKKVSIKKFTWGKEAVLGKLLGSLLKDADFNSFRNLTEKNIQDNPQVVINAFLPLLESAPATVTKMVGTILDKNNEWVEDQLGIEDIIEVLVPFFIGAFKRYQSLYTNLSLRFQK